MKTKGEEHRQDTVIIKTGHSYDPVRIKTGDIYDSE